MIAQIAMQTAPRRKWRPSSRRRAEGALILDRENSNVALSSFTESVLVSALGLYVRLRWVSIICTMVKASTMTASASDSAAP